MVIFHLVISFYKKYACFVAQRFLVHMEIKIPYFPANMIHM